MHSPAVDVESLLRDGVPDWTRIDFDVACARCGYNLRMLTAPRCPECGLEFAWPHALDQTEWRSGLLFEYHWRDRPLESWWNSVRRSIRPRRFWATVSLHDRIHSGPLWVMIFIAMLVYVAIIGVTAEVVSVVSELSISRRSTGTVAGWVAGPSRTSFELLRLVPRWIRMGFGPASLTIHLARANLVVVVLTIAMLGTLRQTLGRCHLRFAHVLRVAAYSATPVCIWWAVIVLGAFAFVEIMPARLVSTAYVDDALPFAGLLLYSCVWAYYLAIGLRTYPRLPRASLLAIVCACVATLAYFTLYAFVGMVVVSIR